jgi:CRP/FNR family transcriptional regulator, anaerobic regulatory protein
VTEQKMQPPNEPCAACRLRRLRAFSNGTPEQIAFIQRHKVGELAVPAGGTLIEEGRKADRLYTLLIGWAFRYKTLPDGRRQILNFLLPGDLIGLQSRLMENAEHGVEALSDTVFCAFERNALWDVFRGFPELAFDITWLGSHEEQIMDEALLSVGRRTAAERMAWLLLHLWRRADQLCMVKDGVLALPLTQSHIADALGLSLVHTNRTLTALRRRGLFELSGGVMRAVDGDGLLRISRRWQVERSERPLF